MRFYIVALLATSIFRVCNGLSFERPVSAPLESVGFQDESDSLPNDGVFEFGPYDDLSHLISASGDQENPFSTGNEVADCGSNAKKNGKTRKGGGGSCPVVYDVQEVQVEECTPAKKLCPTFLEPLCCTGSKRNNGYPFAFDVGSCISYNELNNCRLEVCKLFATVFCCQQLGMVLMDPDGGFGCTNNFL